MARCGGTSEAVAATEETQTLVDSVKTQIEEKLGNPVDSLKALLVSKQVVAGTNFFVKIQTGENEYIHARIFRSLQGEVSVHSIQANQTADSPLEYF
mmetsp:Transcript_6891/g.11566  ORF Transcript_6891/g.11566 Transcript_6891/m.11566 type:complete len:97 (-) Transcript_6891:157-447(-)